VTVDVADTTIAVATYAAAAGATTPLLVGTGVDAAGASALPCELGAGEAPSPPDAVARPSLRRAALRDGLSGD